MKNFSRMCSILIISFFFVGCATLAEYACENNTTISLCSLYGHQWTTHSQRKIIAKELNWREAIKSWEWDLIKARKIQIGMSRNALYASWGAPWDYNKSVGRYGVHIQHIYGIQYSTCVYTRNGEVTSWQN